MADEKDNQQNDQQDELDFSLFNRLVGGREPSIYFNPIWMNNLLKLQDTRPEKFKRDNIKDWIKNPASSENELRELNQYFLNTSSHYKRVAYYFAGLLTFDHLLLPVGVDKQEMKSTAFKKNRKKAEDFLNQFDIKYEFNKIMRIVMGEDVYFGYIRDDGDNFSIQKLPSEWCKLVSRNENGYQYAFDMTYFLLPAVNIDDYPPEFKLYVEQLKTGGTNTGTYYVLLDPDKSFVFKFDENNATIVPPLLGLFLDVLEIDEYKDLVKSRAVLDSYLLLHQKIPMRTDKDAKANQFLIDLNNAAKFHQNTKSNVPQGVEVLTSPMDMAPIKIDKSQNKDSIVGIAESSFFKTAGVSQNLFGESTNSVGIAFGIQTDENFVLHMYRQFERWINRILSSITGSHNFKIIFPDITYYNRSEKQTQFLQAAQFGYPKTLYSASLGIQPQDLTSLADYEDSLGLNDNLVPLKSSHTDSSNGTDKGGRPEKPSSQLSESGAKTRDNATNETN